MNAKFYTFRCTYQFSHSSFGFQNSVTVTALNEDQAKEQATKEISMCYGSKMLKRFKIISTKQV